MDKELTYEEVGQKVSGASDSLYALSKKLDAWWKKNTIPGEKPLRCVYIAAEALRNMSYTLETIADEIIDAAD